SGRSRISWFSRMLKMVANIVLGSTKSSTGTRPPHRLGGAHRRGAPYSSHRAPQRVRLRFSLPCGLVGRLFEQPVRSLSNPHSSHSQGMRLGCLRLRTSDEHSLIVRVPRATKAPSLIPASFSATHSPFPDLPSPRLPSSPARPGIQALAAFPL